jgi:hypothetical protein
LGQCRELTSHVFNCPQVGMYIFARKIIVATFNLMVNYIKALIIAMLIILAIIQLQRASIDFIFGMKLMAVLLTSRLLS